MKSNAIATGVVGIICATGAVLGLATLALVAPPNNPKTNPPLILVPSLTPQTLNRFINTYGRLIAVKFTPNQKRQIQQRLSKEWMTNLGLRRDVLETIDLEPQIAQATTAERDRLQAKMVGDLREQVLDGDTDALWLVSFYDAVPKNWLAKGNPPLNRMMSDMSADALAFMVNEIMGKAIAAPTSELKNAIAKKMTAEYATLPANVKRELSRLPAAWLQFKQTDWADRGEDFREEMRVHWGQNLEPYLPEIRAMSKLRRDRLNQLKADRTAPWYGMNSLQRQAALQKTNSTFETAARSLQPVQTVQLAKYINTMQVGKSIGNSPTRYSQKLIIK
jgi:hypothetical protein